MTRDDIDELWHRATVDAVQAGELYSRYRFAELVAAIEREACEKLADYYDDVIIAKAIRARGKA